MTDQPQPLLRRLWQQWLKPIIVVVVIIAPLRSSVADWNDVPTQSMEPTILVGDRILVNKLAYGLRVPFTHFYALSWSGPQRGDIVVFHAPGDGKRMAKRVIAIPGDRIAMRNNRLFINGAAMPVERRTAAELEANDLTDPAPHLFGLETLDTVEHAVMAQPHRPAPRSFDEITVPAGQYFMMGDNRDNSGDSRSFGFVPRHRILGRAYGTAYSFDHDDWYRPRWSRFLRDLD
ncbi:MAG: signal peptidase I [Phycisphaerales bacterium]|nr:MAG: signal peptidase I [Phycisphaerales bacterium]